MIYNKVLILFFIFGIFISTITGLAQTASAAPEPKILICHTPPGNPDNPHTLSVGESAVLAHVAHGDTLGPCDDLLSGKIIVEKITVGGDGDFDFTGEITTTLSDGETAMKDVVAGMYTITETVPDGWTLTDVTCVEDGTDNSSGNKNSKKAEN